MTKIWLLCGSSNIQMYEIKKKLIAFIDDKYINVVVYLKHSVYECCLLDRNPNAWEFYMQFKHINQNI